MKYIPDDSFGYPMIIIQRRNKYIGTIELVDNKIDLELWEKVTIRELADIVEHIKTVL